MKNQKTIHEKWAEDKITILPAQPKRLEYTTQEVINMGADMYDNQGYTREAIKTWLVDLLTMGHADFDLDRIFDLIVG